MTENSGEYQLIFEGLEDQSADAVRKLKGVLIAEAQLSVDEVKDALDNPPKLLKASHSEKVIKSLARKLKEASAKVTVLSPEPESAPEPEVLSGNLIEFDSSELEPEPEAPAEEPASDSGLEFAFDPDELEASAKKKEEIPTYELDLDETLDPSLLEFQDEEEEAKEDPSEEAPPSEKEPHPPSAAEPDTLDDKALDAQLDNLLDLTISDDPVAVPEERVETPVSEEIDTSTLKFDDEPASPATEREAPVEKESAPEPVVASGLSFDEPLAEPPAPKLDEKPKAEAVTLEAEKAPPPAAEKKVEKQKEVKAPEPAAPPLADGPIGRLGDRLKSRKAMEDPEVASDSEGVVPEDEGPATEPPARNTRGKGLFGRHEIAIPVIIGALVLGVVNWFVFSSSEDDIDLELKKAIEANLAKPPIVKQPSAEKPKIEPTQIPRAYIKLTGSSEADGISTKAEMMANDESILSGSLSIETPEPRELTPEEIVQNKVRPPWVTHIDIDAQQIQPSADGAFEWQGPAKVYIEYQGQRDRLLASASLIGRYHPKEARFEVRYEIKRPAGIDARNRTFFIEANDKDRYLLALRGSLTGIETGRQVDGPGSAPVQSSAPANP